jgi:membrane protease YdiL (CAAX protease family)
MIKEIIEEVVGRVSIFDVLFYATGILLLAVWLLKTSWGAKSLAGSPPRRNDMLPHIAFIPFFFWFLTAWLLALIKEKAFPDLSGWQDAFTKNLVLCLSAAPAIATALVVAKRHFARGLNGLGLNPRTIPKDFGSAFLNFLTIMPVVLTGIILTAVVGKLVFGPEFEIPKHEELKQIFEYPQLALRVSVVITAVLVVPFTEEILFRGMLQTLLRSYIVRPWASIVVTSLVFIIFHENPQHWPALFVFGLCLGYTYEKSGSLIRAVFLHAMFNALSVFAALRQ